MKYLWHIFDQAMDRLDVGGWMMLTSGFVILATTVLYPAWLDARGLDIQRRQLRRQVALLTIQEQNYHAFVRAVDRNDPLLLQRLAWGQLRQQPTGAVLMMRNTLAPAPSASVDPWVRPTALPMTVRRADDVLTTDSRLMRLITGPSRPWVMALGGWLILMSLLMNPCVGEPTSN